MAEDWQRCEKTHHVGDDRDPTVTWRDLGLTCDTCYAAIGDRRSLQALLDAERQRAEEAERGRDRWREECWAIYVESGADTDGADARHLNPGEAVAAVRELRGDYDECQDHLWAAEAKLATATEALREVAEYEEGWLPLPADDMRVICRRTLQAIERDGGAQDE